MTQNKQYVEQHKNFGRMRAVPHLCGCYPGIFLTTEEKARKNLKPLRPLDRGQSLLVDSETSHRVLKFCLLCSKVISNVTPQDNRATAPDVSRLRTLRYCSTVPPAPGPIKQPLTFPLSTVSGISFLIVPSPLNFPPILSAFIPTQF
jgi:hypothetical protein